MPDSQDVAMKIQKTMNGKLLNIEGNEYRKLRKRGGKERIFIHKRGKFADMRLEYQLLLCCARTGLSKDNQDKIRKLASNDLNWEYLLQMSKSHGLAPLLYYHLHQTDHDHQIPQSIMNQLHDIYYGNLARNIPLSYELDKILNVFEKKGIPVVILRGLSLAQTIYKNIGLRVATDIDLLVQKKDLSRVAKTLLELEFTPPQFGLLTDEYSAELCFAKQTAAGSKYLGSVYIDVHQDITSSIRLKEIIKTDTERVITRARLIRTNSANMLVMVPEDLVLHLTLRHCFQKLFRLCDIAEVIKLKKNELNWQSLLQKTKENRLSIIMYYTLYYTRQLLEAPVPDEVLKELTPNWYRKKLLDNLLSTAVYPADSGNLSRGRKYFLQILMSDRLIDVFLVLWKVMFPRSEWLVYYYGHSRSKKLYLSHLFNLFTILLAGIRDILKVSGKR